MRALATLETVRAFRERGYSFNPQTIGEHILKRRMDLTLTRPQVARDYESQSRDFEELGIGATQPAVRRLPSVESFVDAFPMESATTHAEFIRREGEVSAGL